MPEPKLMDLSHGGGCGCKVSPDRLSELLAGTRSGPDSGFASLLVGNDKADDCAAWQLDDGKVLVSTTDFFMPVVNDPQLFGRIAATNAISDVYAMGARPIYALALVGMPIDKLSAGTIGAILGGGGAACADAGIPIAGGHTIDCVEPIYGLAVNGLCQAEHLVRNDGAHAGDALILGKPLGVGIISAALRKQADADGALLDELAGVTTLLNTPGPALAEKRLASAMSDVTGFGLLGHTLELCRGAQLRARLDWDSIPLLACASSLARDGLATGASGRNWTAYGEQVDTGSLEQWRINMLTDPQTSGGLLVACEPGNAAAVLDIFKTAGFAAACQVGTLASGEPGVEVA